MKILVGLSGGVDSAVAALLLKQAGHDVTGATMAIWSGKNPWKGGHRNACYGPDEKEDIESARAVAETIGIVGPACIQCFREPDGSLVTQADLTGVSDHGWNEMVLDGRGNVYVNGAGFAAFDVQ